MKMLFWLTLTLISTSAVATKWGEEVPTPEEQVKAIALCVQEGDTYDNCVNIQNTWVNTMRKKVGNPDRYSDKALNVGNMSPEQVQAEAQYNSDQADYDRAVSEARYQTRIIENKIKGYRDYRFPHK